MIDKIFEELHKKIKEAEDVCIITVSSERCDRQETTLVSNIKNYIRNHDPSVLLFDICVPEDEMPHPRIVTKISYFYIPGNERPVLYRIGNLDTDALRHNLTIVRKIKEGSDYEQIAYPGKPGIIQKVDDMIESEDISQLPSTFQQTRNLAIDAWKVSKRLLTGGHVLAPAEVAAERMKICETCPFFQNSRCTKCGCFMTAKTHLATAECPVGNWSKVDV